MPSTLVHLGFAALLAAGLLADDFGPRSLGIVLVAAAFPDLDVLLGLWGITGAHRTVLHNLLIPSVVMMTIAWDRRRPGGSRLNRRWGEGTARVALIAVGAGWLTANVGLDAFYNGVNLFWPFWDQFIDLSGAMVYSTDRGLIQSFIGIEWTGEGLRIDPVHLRGSSAETHYATGTDPGAPPLPTQERVFRIADSGPLVLLTITGFAVAGYRLLREQSVA